jgi:pilus assembly protein CpaB
VVVPTVTLEVTPEEGERLALSAQEGRISLILRGQGDQSVVETPGVDASRLFRRPAKVVQAAVPKAAPPPQRMVDVIRGVEREPVNF